MTHRTHYLQLLSAAVRHGLQQGLEELSRGGQGFKQHVAIARQMPQRGGALYHEVRSVLRSLNGNNGLLLKLCHKTVQTPVLSSDQVICSYPRGEGRLLTNERSGQCAEHQSERSILARLSPVSRLDDVVPNNMPGHKPGSWAQI